MVKKIQDKIPYKHRMDKTGLSDVQIVEILDFLVVLEFANSNADKFLRKFVHAHGIIHLEYQPSEGFDKNP